MKNQLFRKYHRRIVKEAVLKSAAYGLIAGSSALLLTALFSWFFGFREGLWLAIGLFGAGFAVTALCLYYLKFRPTTKTIAERVDALGLEERLITMYELQGDESYMAKLQRKDAMQAMSRVDSMLLKVIVSVALIAVLAVSLLVGLGGGTAVSSLYYSGAIPSGLELLSSEEPGYLFTCSYTASTESSGMIVLWTDELAAAEEDIYDPTAGLVPVEESYEVKEGEDAPAVYAVPSIGYTFLTWSDGVRDPYRQDKAVMGSIRVSAIFVQIGGDVEQFGTDIYYGDGDGNQDNSNYDGGEDVVGGNNNGDQANPDANHPGGDEPGGDGRHDSANQQIIDGEHYYGDSFEDAFNDAEGRLGSDSNIPGDLKGWISDYYGSIETGGSGGEAGGEGNP